jgi:hypothetical protein
LPRAFAIAAPMEGVALDAIRAGASISSSMRLPTSTHGEALPLPAHCAAAGAFAYDLAYGAGARPSSSARAPRA